MHPYLMCASRFQLKAHERVFSKAFKHLVVRHRPSARLVDRHFLPLFLASCDRLVHNAFVFLEVAVAKPVVYTARGLFLNLTCKALVRLIVLCHDDKPRRVLVKPMHDAGTYHAVYAAQTVEIVQKRIDERVVFLIRACLMHHHTLRLVDHRHIFVLVHDVKRDILRLDFENFSLGQLKLDNIAEF